MRARQSCLAALLAVFAAGASAREQAPTRWLWSTACAVPKHATSEGSGYFSLVEGHNRRLYIGTAKYGENAYLVEFDTKTKRFRVVVDAMKAIGSAAAGFAAQAKIHTRNHVGRSGRIYLGTKQGYPKKGESRTDYPGGFPMVYDPATGRTRVYPIPVPRHGIISIAPDESRGVAYLSTCSDERPIDTTIFLILDLQTGQYTRLMDCRHMYAFIVVDHLGRAYHPMLGGSIIRYDPRTRFVEKLRQTIDGRPPTRESLLAAPHSHPINWDISPDRKTLYAVPMNGNQLYAYNLADTGTPLRGRSLGKLIQGATKTDCRAMCVGPKGSVWMGVAATTPDRRTLLHLVSYRPGDKAPRGHGPIAIRNPDYTELTDKSGKPLPWHHGVTTTSGGTRIPRYHIMGICRARNGRVYLTTLYPFTLHEIDVGGK